MQEFASPDCGDLLIYPAFQPVFVVSAGALALGIDIHIEFGLIRLRAVLCGVPAMWGRGTAIWRRWEAAAVGEDGAGRRAGGALG
ncbi:hypothetical protein PLEOSDRAFT_1069970, partial [Pleurotus ostreatus PC15]